MGRISFSLAFLICALVALGGCQGQEQPPSDLSPMPTVAAPPYICDQIPLRAVELMTGISRPLARGSFDLGEGESGGSGSCAIYKPDGSRGQVMLITLTKSGFRGFIEDRLENGESRLPEIVPGSIGSYFAPSDSEDNEAYAHLVGGNSELIVEMEHGAPGRDNAADVAALMKLIAPKLLGADATPSASPTAKQAEKSGEG